jgi:integral membrane protein
MNSRIRAFATVALIEGISYIVLLGIAMPLKYYFGIPLAVKIVGWAHGILFMLYMILLLRCWIECKWTLSRVIFYFTAALLPIVPFFVEKRLKREYSGA